MNDKEACIQYFRLSPPMAGPWGGLDCKQASKVIQARVGKKGKKEKMHCNAIQFNSKLVGLQASRLTYWLLGQGHAQEAWQEKGGLHMDDHCQHGTCGFSAASRY